MKKKIAYVINHISFFTSHILPLAIEAKKKGYEIKIFCGEGGSRETEIVAKKMLIKNKIDLRSRARIEPEMLDVPTFITDNHFFRTR